MSEHPVNVVATPIAATVRASAVRDADAHASVTSGSAHSTEPEVGTSVIQEDAFDALLTVIVPVYNEAATVNQLLRRVVEAPLDTQIIVVDDGSTDGTTAILERWEGHPLIELLAHSRNRGKGAAIRTGLEHARGRYTIVQDALNRTARC